MNEARYKKCRFFIALELETNKGQSWMHFENNFLEETNKQTNQPTLPLKSPKIRCVSETLRHAWVNKLVLVKLWNRLGKFFKVCFFFKSWSLYYICSPKIYSLLIVWCWSKVSVGSAKESSVYRALLALATLRSSRICFIQILVHGRQRLGLASWFVEWIKTTAPCNAHWRLQVLASKWKSEHLVNKYIWTCAKFYVILKLIDISWLIFWIYPQEVKWTPNGLGFFNLLKFCVQAKGFFCLFFF